MHHLNTSYQPAHQYEPIFARLTQAQSLLQSAYALELKRGALVADRLTRERMADAAQRCLGAVVDQIIEALDLVTGDPDLESNDAEDEELGLLAIEAASNGAGCNLADAGEDEWDREFDDEREREEATV